MWQFIVFLAIFAGLTTITTNGQLYVPNALKSYYSGSSYLGRGGVKTISSGVKTMPSGIKTIKSSYFSGGSGYTPSRSGCSPPCENGGKCVGIMCLCPTEFTGSQCQYRKDDCNFKKMNFNGAYKCSGSGESITCSVSCPQGSFFEYTPATLYTCYYRTGYFQPSAVPQCILEDPNARWVSSGVKTRPVKESKIIRINTTLSGYHGVKTAMKQRRIQPQPGVCLTWSGAHYKTFDGKVFSFLSKCSHILLRDSSDNTFEVIVKNDQQKHALIIKVYMSDKQFYLRRSDDDNTVIFGDDTKTLPIPSQMNGLKVYKLAHFVIVSIENLGLHMKWDSEYFLQVNVNENLWNKTEGLCGRLDGVPVNDLLMSNHKKTKNIFNLATSWKTDDFGDVCSDLPNDQHACKDDKVAALKATSFCKKLLNDDKFIQCQKAMDTSVLLDACKWDYCSCQKTDPTQCACEVMNIFVKECIHKGIVKSLSWRDQNICPIQCSGGRIYKSCGPSHQPTCGSVSLEVHEDQNNSEEATSDSDTCIEGCFCPNGTVLQDDQCIQPDQCKCKLRGKYFQSGEIIKKDCNTCTCHKNGQWICTEIKCDARCSIVGDPHYTTFDGKHYDFMGQCSYYLLKTKDLTIEAENVACNGAISKILGFGSDGTSLGSMPSCTKTLTIHLPNAVINLKQNHEVFVNGKVVEKLPYKLNDKLIIKRLTNIYIVAKLSNGIAVWWDGTTRVHIDIPANFDEKTKGLCGTYNGNQKDDFLTPENDIETTPVPFANKWKVDDEQCSDLPNIPQPHPCDLNVHKKHLAEQQCLVIKSKLFQECHLYVDPEHFYQDCLYDMCSCGGNEQQISKCLCPIIAAYSEECSRQQNLQIDWRNEVKHCGIQCYNGQKYQLCGNSCYRTCADISSETSASGNCNQQQCVEGCTCPEGQVLDSEDGECISIEQCSCSLNGEDYPAGYQEIRKNLGEAQLCTCVNALWSCIPATIEDLAKYSEPTEPQLKCNTSDNFEFTTCKDLQQITCKNMHSELPAKNGICKSGCQCKKGYVLDTTNNRCVKPQECPCSHGGRSFNENEHFKIDCNSCICKSAKWHCSQFECPGECSTFGDSHYKTFDGKHYDYQGQCDYVFAKGSTTLGSFDISIQSVPCSTLGTTCSKSITIRISHSNTNEKSILTLTKDKPLPKTSSDLIQLRQKGLFIIVDVRELGLQLLWDHGTRIYLKLSTQWKNKVKGLCGNYNDNINDDFQTPSGGFVEVSAKIFGDSWKLQSYCPETLEIQDTCRNYPERHIWAKKKCNLLKSQLFQMCHTEVPVDHYYEKCIFDSCACDQGGDCECLCTALAAYAHECNKKGVHIRWRSQELCPIQCDEHCSSYSPCVSICPIETCDNLLEQQKYKFCSEEQEQNDCVEGCDLKACPSGHIYTNSSYLECTPKKLCKTPCLVIENRTYYEGDTIEEDQCHKCQCIKGQKVCKGQSCKNLEITDEIPLEEKPLDLIQCKSGWTKWINRKKILSSKTKSSAKQRDVEEIPSIRYLSTLENSAVCDRADMKDIQCRTVRSRVPWNKTGLKVNCDLDKGLICYPESGKSCPDFEIRINCQCEEKMADTVANFIEETIKPSKCPPGQIYDECAFDCDNLCHYYSSIVKEKGFCQNGDKCSPGCVPEKKQQKCQKGQFWINPENCLNVEDCMCRSRDGKLVKPGTVYQESECEFCQCIDNFYTCDKSACIEEETTDIKVPLEEIEEETAILPIESILEEDEEILIPSTTVTPPNKCQDKHYVNLISTEPPLQDESFTASSTLNKYFSPWNARLNQPISKTSGGSWMPKQSSKNEYLQINLNNLEAIYGVIIGGSRLYDQYVTSFRILYSTDGVKYFYIVDDDEEEKRKKQPQIFRGPLEARTPVKVMFSQPIEAKFLRINPLTWHDEIALRVELIGCRDDLPTAKLKPKELLEVEEIKTTSEYIKEPMGLSDGMLSDEQIVVSSELRPKFNKSSIKLQESKNFWQPLTNSPDEFVQFNFYDKRILTGLVTKGGNNGWITSYKLTYSSDGVNWNPLLNDITNEEMIFYGNYDNKNRQVNYFKKPIKTQYLKLLPVTWQEDIQLQTELLGKYEPYPVVPTTTPVKKQKFPTKCNNCPGFDITEDVQNLNECKCKDNLWYDGENCVERSLCPCIIGNNHYPVATMFENHICEQCLCRLGGISSCKPKRCPKCDLGLRSTVTTTCDCTCEPCPEGTTLCPTSNTCISTESWCDGIEDCPDDEKDCEIIRKPEDLLVKDEPRPTIGACPKLTCPPGFRVVEDKVIEQKDDDTQNESAMFRLFRKTKSYIKTKYTGIKSAVTKGMNLKKPEIVTQSSIKRVCPKYHCELIEIEPEIIEGKKECPLMSCPPNFKKLQDHQDDKDACPKFSCVPPPPQEVLCNVTGNIFNTFDGVEFEYDICNHVLVRDLIHDNFDISVRKNCTKQCRKTVAIRHQDHVIVFNPDLTIEYDGFVYTIEQTKKISEDTQAFTIDRLGKTLLFTSNYYGFWLLLDKQNNIKIGVVAKLLEEIDGLCGFYNNNPYDDKRKPDGNPARTTEIFGNSWALPDQSQCDTKTCPIEHQTKALKLCHRIKDESFKMCHNKVSIDAFITKCIETTCLCLETNNEEQCKCQALENFVTECLSNDPDLDLPQWRIQHDCPATCEAPFVYYDCYRRKCEPTCDTINDLDEICPKVPKLCFPGCYCPPGLVRYKNQCIKPLNCRDCECNVLPFLKYVTYDQNDFLINGNCTYIMSRDIVQNIKSVKSSKRQQHKFQVLITNGKCRGHSEKVCIEKVTLLYKRLTIQVLHNDLNKNLIVLINDKPKAINTSIEKSLEIRRKPNTKHLKFFLKDLQIDITVYYPSLGVSIKAPSHKYSGKFEGLCGDCNKDPKNDIPNDVEALTQLWSYDNEHDKCKNQPVKKCKPLDTDPCLQLLDQNKFGQCLKLNKPDLFLEWCHHDICYANDESLCTSIEAYANDCTSSGFCTNWRTQDLCPPKTCPIGQVYKTCELECQKTCNNDADNCEHLPKEGCYCPDGLVQLNDTCVKPEFCQICDDQGHHHGDIWQKDKCTKCKCDGVQMKCEQQQCPSDPICETGFILKRLPTNADECCNKTVCIKEVDTVKCTEPQALHCGPGQVMKLDKKPNGCQQFICECIPIDDCDKIDNVTNVQLDDGYVKEIDTTGCCPIVKLVCKKELCPEPPKCQQFYNLEKINDSDGCCPKYQCTPPKDKCLYETQYKIDEYNKEIQLEMYEKQQLIKDLDETWFDGACRECKCTKTKSNDYVALCTKLECLTIEQSPDFHDYQLEYKHNSQKCCPDIVRTGCKDDANQVYNIGEKWTKHDDICTIIECKQTDDGNNVKKDILVTNCNKNCDYGYEYQESKDPNQCCGQCKLQQCIDTDGKLHKIDDVWVSDDFCTQYYCIMVNDTPQIQTILENCDKPSEDLQNDYNYDIVKIDGKCCKQYVKTSCKYGNKTIDVGEIVHNDYDKCEQIVCKLNDKNEIIKQTSIETCNKECKLGYEYQEALDKCCGDCVQTHCVINEQELHKPGDKWQSDDLCTTFTCESIGDHQLTITTQQESCPFIDDCPVENLYQKDCCKYCNLTSESLSTCTPTPVALPKTIGLIQVNHTKHGLCKNKESIVGFMECQGSCYSSHAYNSLIGHHESICECCRGIKFKMIDIPLECDDYVTWTKKISLPISCKCQACGGMVKTNVKTG